MKRTFDYSSSSDSDQKTEKKTPIQPKQLKQQINYGKLLNLINKKTKLDYSPIKSPEKITNQTIIKIQDFELSKPQQKQKLPIFQHIYQEQETEKQEDEIIEQQTINEDGIQEVRAMDLRDKTWILKHEIERKKAEQRGIKDLLQPSKIQVNLLIKKGKNMMVSLAYDVVSDIQNKEKFEEEVYRSKLDTKKRYGW